jgi:Skp family chaperone for outer membrane proteins
MTIGVVDTNRVLAESKPGAVISGKLQQLSDKWQQQVALAEQRLDDAQNRLSKLTAATPPPTAFKQQHEARMLELALRHTQELAQAELEAYSEYWQAALSQNLAQELDRVGKAKKLSLVVTGPNAQIPYVDTALDVTTDVIAAFNASFKEEAY